MKDVNNSIVQVVKGMVRRIRSGGRAPSEWRPPGRREIDKACVGERHMAVAVGGVDVLCFDLSGPNQDLITVGEMDVGADVSALHLGATAGMQVRACASSPVRLPRVIALELVHTTD
jgi:hypothetical protein